MSGEIVGYDLEDLFRELEAWEPTDVHITPVYDDGWLDSYDVAVVVPGRRTPVVARDVRVDDAFRTILIILDTEG